MAGPTHSDNSNQQFVVCYDVIDNNPCWVWIYGDDPLTESESQPSVVISHFL